MSDLISRQAAIDALGDEVTITGVSNACVFKDYVLRVKRKLENLPSAEPKHGKWNIEISHDGYQATYRCSECGHQFKWIYAPHCPPVFNYCQKCGARMRVDASIEEEK